MSYQFKSLPAVPPSGDQNQRRFNEAVRDLMTGMTKGANRLATLADVKDAVGGIKLEDLSVPPAVTNLVASGAFQNIILTFDYPAYGNHAFTRIFRANVNDFTKATVIASAGGKVWADLVGGGQTFYYWAANVSTSDIQGPVNAVAGTKGTTKTDPNAILDILAGQILDSYLSQSLMSRIALIDGPEWANGTVAARIKAEADARVNGDSAEAYQRSLLQATVTANNNALNGRADTLNAAILNEQTARANADSAISQQVTTLQTNVNGQISSVQQTMTAQGNTLGQLSAQWTVKVDVNGRVAGVGLASDGNVSMFTILADRLAVLIPGANGGTPQVPFVIGNVDGNASVIMRSTMIGDATIRRAAIQDLAVDDAKVANLSAAKVTFGEMSGDRIAVNSMDANRLTVASFRAKLATIEDAYIKNANIENLTIGTEKFTGNAVSMCAYFQTSSGGSGGAFPQGQWVDFNTAVTGGGGGGGGGSGGGGGGYEQPRLSDGTYL